MEEPKADRALSEERLLLIVSVSLFGGLFFGVLYTNINALGAGGGGSPGLA